MDIKIEKDVPVPITNAPATKYASAVRALEIGDSFWVSKSSVASSFPMNVRNLSLGLGIKITLRTVEQDGVIGWRVWRIEKPDKNGNE